VFHLKPKSGRVQSFPLQEKVSEGEASLDLLQPTINHRIIEEFGLKGTLKITYFQPRCHGQGHLPLDQFAQLQPAKCVVIFCSSPSLLCLLSCLLPQPTCSSPPSSPLARTAMPLTLPFPPFLHLAVTPQPTACDTPSYLQPLMLLPSHFLPSLTVSPVSAYLCWAHHHHHHLLSFCPLFLFTFSLLPLAATSPHLRLTLLPH